MIVNGYWQPDLSPTGADVMNDKHRFLLLHGPRKTAKTCTLSLKLAKHLYEVPNARVAVVVHRNQTGKNGTWDDITSFALGMNFQQKGGVLPYMRAPAFTSDTKTSSFVVRNAYGNPASCTMYGLYNQKDAERIFKTTRFSFVYITEADLFLDGGIFRVISDQLRAIGVPYEKHQLVLDCNPPVMGSDHWLYSLFFDHSLKDPVYAAQFREIGMTFDDNPFLPPQEKAELVAAYVNDPKKYNRLVLGKWSRSAVGTLYEGVFDFNRHVIGLPEPGQSPEEVPVLVPSEESTELISGWDLGHGVNHAWVLMSRRSVGPGRNAYDVLDEVVSIGVECSLDELVDRIMRRIKFWEALMKRRGAAVVEHRCWSDSSSFVYSSGVNGTEARLVQSISGGMIHLRPAPKGPNSVADRVMMVRRMLKDGNLVISSRCKRLIDSLSTMRVKTFGQTKDEVLRATDPRKHVFDAMSYAISAENPRMAYLEASPSTEPERRFTASIRL